MVWVDGRADFTEFLFLFPASFIGWGITALLLSKFVPDGMPPFNKDEKRATILEGGKVIMGLFALTIIFAIVSHQLLHLPAMWGMMFGLAILKIYVYIMNRRNRLSDMGDDKQSINAFSWIAKIENDTLLFFFGILAAVGGLHFLGFLDYFTKL